MTSNQARRLQTEGLPATAVVLEVQKPLLNVGLNRAYARRKLRIRIERDDGAPPYEASYAERFPVGGLPDPGDSFRVVVDPKRPRRLAPASASTPPPPRRPLPRRSIWKFTSWHGPKQAHPRKPTYTPYDPDGPDSAAAEDSASPE